MKRTEALEFMLDAVADDDVAVFSNGIVSREAFMIKDRPGNFYMLASMGHAPMIGFGIAGNIPSKVYVFDGDGNFFMNPGGSAMIGAAGPANLVHIIFDNKCYETTGAQASISRAVDIVSVGEAFGYSCSKKVGSLEALKEEFAMAVKNDGGPAMLVVDVEIEDDDRSRIIPLSPQEMAARLRRRCVELRNAD